MTNPVDELRVHLEDSSSNLDTCAWFYEREFITRIHRFGSMRLLEASLDLNSINENPSFTDLVGLSQKIKGERLSRRVHESEADLILITADDSSVAPIVLDKIALEELLKNRIRQMSFNSFSPASPMSNGYLIGTFAISPTTADALDLNQRKSGKNK